MIMQHEQWNESILLRVEKIIVGAKHNFLLIKIINNNITQYKINFLSV